MMKRLDPPIDEEEYRVLNFSGMSDYDRNKSVNIPDAFSLIPKGDGFDKVTYYKKNLLEKVARKVESSYI
jgi:hypothetical protein